MLGKSTLSVEVLSIESNGIWLHAKEKEYFLPHQDFPWFKEARVIDVLNVELLHGFHLYWPSLDIDLDLESLEDLGKYPLVYH
jgi:hypothetical protein